VKAGISKKPWEARTFSQEQASYRQLQTMILVQSEKKNRIMFTQLLQLAANPDRPVQPEDEDEVQLILTQRR